jgi:hypothetical protein
MLAGWSRETPAGRGALKLLRISYNKQQKIKADATRGRKRSYEETADLPRPVRRGAFGKVDRVREERAHYGQAFKGLNCNRQFISHPILFHFPVL